MTGINRNVRATSLTVSSQIQGPNAQLNGAKSTISLPLDPQVALNSLGAILSKGNISKGERLNRFKDLVRTIILNPSHPYSELDDSLRGEMINSIAKILADDPNFPIPT